MKNWTPSSWRNFNIMQQPDWPCKETAEKIMSEIHSLPPLVFAGEIRSLRAELAKAEEGKAFLLQAGDCAEEFAGCNAISIKENLKTILQMSVILTFGASKPIIKLGRIAGQYAKPRSSSTEIIDGVELASYRGDIVNGPLPILADRTPNPERVKQAYFHSAATLNLLRAFVHGGFADLHKVHLWNKEFISTSPQGKKFDVLASKIDDALNFMNACGLGDIPEIREADFYTSHEALLLGYEEALTRKDSITGKYYDCSAHMIWIGDRTRQLDGAHVEFFRGVNNPIGIKVGPTCSEDELIKILDTLNPENEKGRITLISRFGAKKIHDFLPKLAKRVKDEGRNALWSCDPMHGNTFTATSNLKTRDFNDIASEIKSFFTIHYENGSVPGGVHFELTGGDVTEVRGGAQNLQDHDLSERYKTNCDPRLNGKQSLEMAFQIAEMLRPE